MNRKQDTAGSRRRTPGPKRTKATGMRHSSDRTDRTDKDLTGPELLALAEATGRLQPDPFPRWVDISGAGEMPDPHPGEIAAVLALVFAPFHPDPVTLIHEGRAIYTAMLNAADQEARREQPATAEQTYWELRELASACRKMETVFERLRRPAREILDGQLYDYSDRESPIKDTGQAWSFVSDLRSYAEDGARDVAHGVASGPGFFGMRSPVSFLGQPSGGRPRKHVASAVCYRSAVAFWRVTGERPTFTTDPETNQTTGIWIDVLSGVFDALTIKASVEAQARAFGSMIADESPETFFENPYIDMQF